MTVHRSSRTHGPQPRRRNRLQTINQGVGPFYVVKARGLPSAAEREEIEEIMSGLARVAKTVETGHPAIARQD